MTIVARERGKTKVYTGKCIQRTFHHVILATLDPKKTLVKVKTDNIVSITE